MKTTLALVLGLALAATSALANPPLRDVTRITEGLIATGMAYELSEKCSSLNARTLRGINFLFSLRQHAQELGYSDAEIEAYTDNRAEQDRLEAIARERLAALGVREGDEASYCRVGRDQIAQGSQVGRLLR